VRAQGGGSKGRRTEVYIVLGSLAKGKGGEVEEGNKRVVKQVLERKQRRAILAIELYTA